MPDEVGRLQFEEISDRAVKVVWSPPEHINGVLTGYTLSYSVRDKPDTLKSENLTADTLSVKVTQLQVSLTFNTFFIFVENHRAWSYHETIFCVL